MLCSMGSERLKFRMSFPEISFESSRLDVASHPSLHMISNKISAEEVLDDNNELGWSAKIFSSLLGGKPTC